MKVNVPCTYDFMYNEKLNELTARNAKCFIWEGGECRISVEAMPVAPGVFVSKEIYQGLLRKLRKQSVEVKIDPKGVLIKWDTGESYLNNLLIYAPSSAN